MRTEYVTCSICGEMKPTDHECYQCRLKKYGSVEEMNKKWVCLSCKRARKNGEANIKKEDLTPAERRKILQKKLNKALRESIPYYYEN